MPIFLWTFKEEFRKADTLISMYILIHRACHIYYGPDIFLVAFYSGNKIIKLESDNSWK